MRGSRRTGSIGRVALAALVCFAAMLAAAGSASADSATLTVTNTGGQSDPAAGVARVFTVAGTAGVPEQLFVSYRATGGAGCAPSARSDTGTILDISGPGGYGPFWAINVNGAFKQQDAFTWRSPGPVMFCIWLAANDQTVTTPITQVVDFRAPSGTISATLSPATPRPGQAVTATITGSSEAPEYVYATLRSGGGACAPTYTSDTGSSLVDGTSVNGAFSLQQTTSALSAGAYTLCLWLASSSSDTAPVAGPQPIPFTVSNPPPACVVPSLRQGESLATARQAIARAHCSVGRVSSIRSRRVRRGGVVSFSPRTHTRLGNGAAVNVVVSRGR